MIEAAIRKIESGGSLSMDETADVLGRVMDGAGDDDQIARLLAALHRKGETVAEVAGAALALRRRMTPIRSSRRDLLDTCGTGGDGSQTFNISTAAALVAAAAGAAVAKHGNRAATSRSGSADVLSALGVNIEADATCVEACLEELGICFCFAPLLHPAMRRVSAVRKRLGTPTIFNLLGPLANPASAPFQILGVGRAETQSLVAEALVLLGDCPDFRPGENGTAPLATGRALVVRGDDGLDEVTLGGTTVVLEVEAEKGTVPFSLKRKSGQSSPGRKSGQSPRRFEWTPADFGLPPAGRETMIVATAAESAAMIRDILDGQRGPPRDVALANAAAALWTVGAVATPVEGVARAAEAVDSGAARALLARLVERTNR
jgi:anthranilate phosphoribosyltransferase